ncbi:MAG: low affinity iron permease family protein, partial [Acidimicrobiales bacterium]
PHSHQRRNRFDRFAERAVHVVSGAPFFAICAVFIVVWVPTLWIMKPEPSQLMVQTVTAIVTFLMVALLQNSQRRNEEAVNLKLNAIAQAVADLMRERTGEDQDLRDNIERLTRTVGLEERVTTRRRTPTENGAK